MNTKSVLESLVSRQDFYKDSIKASSGYDSYEYLTWLSGKAEGIQEAIDILKAAEKETYFFPMANKE
jgi:hypothetical protein